MFGGLKLTAEQGEAIARMAEEFAVERAGLLPNQDVRAPWDSETKRRLAPFIERQRKAYRAVLTPEQRRVFDRNTDRILLRWREQGPYPGPGRPDRGNAP